MNQDFECPRCGHCFQIQQAAQHAVEVMDDHMMRADTDEFYEAKEALRQALETEPEALRLADALDAEFVQGRISNSTGRESAVELRRLALKQWVGLTAYEIQEIHSGNQHWGNFACAIEAKLKEKNT